MLELASGLDRNEFEPIILTTEAGGGGLATRSQAAGIRTHVVPYSYMRRHFPLLGHYVVGPLALRRLLKREHVSIVHAHCPNSALPIMRAATGLGLPLVQHVHDFDQRWVTPAKLRLFNRAPNLVVGVSDAAARYVAQQGVSSDRVRRVYNGVHLPQQQPRQAARSALGASDDEIVLGLVGRLAARKGHEDLLRAMADPRLAQVKLRAFFIGGPESAEPEQRARLQRQILELNAGLEQRTVFVGHRDDAAALAAGFDIAVVPSRREAFGRAAIEAMQAGIPVVVTREGGLPELVRDGCEGVVVEPGNVEQLSAALVRLAHEPALRASMGARGRERAGEFSHARFVNSMTMIYHELLRAPRWPQ
jgi:glycosyltransferase involved in cell wall biosynthesis